MNIIVYKTNKTRKGNKSFLVTSVERKLTIVLIILERKPSFGSEISRQEETHSDKKFPQFNSDKKIIS